ncbi:MAG: HIT family protein [Lachnospiraceae bacterium]|nr:HIT family protein [Lachnospiraceae bacterium]
MKNDNCIFCKIAAGEIPSKTVYEDDMFRVVMDLGAASEGHALILPKNHYTNLMELDEKTAAGVLPLAGKIARAMIKGLKCDGLNLVQNNGEEAGQTVMHFHLHMIPRYKGGAEVIAWKPGNPTQEELENTAEKIRAEL